MTRSWVGAGQEKSAPGYTWLHETVTKDVSRLRPIRQKHNQGR